MKTNIILLMCLVCLIMVDCLSQEQRQEILDYHNKLRGSVVPPATNMLKMRYDYTLESLAEKWVKRCKYAHPDKKVYREFKGIGQNLAITGGMTLDLSEMVKMWYDERKDFDYFENTCAPEKVCGHYTQVVWWNSNRLGCAARRCDITKPTWPKPVYLLACQYAPQGNYIGKLPYEGGDSCSKCPKYTNCSQNLCSDGGPDFTSSAAARPIYWSFVLSFSLIIFV